MSIGPWYRTWTFKAWPRCFGSQVDYVADANAPGRWRPVSYRRTLFGVPLTWWRQVHNTDTKPPSD